MKTIFKSVIIVGVVVFSLASCTVIQPIVPNTAPGYDQNTRDSGVIGVLADNEVLVTGYVKAGYDHLIITYGNDFMVPLVNDDGVFNPLSAPAYRIKDKNNPGQFVMYTADPKKSYFEMTGQFVNKYLDMCDWANSGIDPVTNDPHVSPSTQKPPPAVVPIPTPPPVTKPVTKGTTTKLPTGFWGSILKLIP